MRLCLLSLPGPVPGLLGSWGQFGTLLFFQGVKEHYPLLSSPSPVISLSDRSYSRCPPKRGYGRKHGSGAMHSGDSVPTLLPSSCVTLSTLLNLSVPSSI